MTTFDIIDEFKALEDLLYEVDEETGEVKDNSELLKEEIERLNLSRNEKLNNLERLKRAKKAQIEAIKEEVQRLRKRADVIANEVDRLSDLEMWLTQGEKVDTGLYRFGTRKSTVVEIENEELIPPQFKKEEVVVKINKNELKKWLKEHPETEGAKLIEKINLSVR